FLQKRMKTISGECGRNPRKLYGRLQQVALQRLPCGVVVTRMAIWVGKIVSRMDSSLVGEFGCQNPAVLHRLSFQIPLLNSKLEMLKRPELRAKVKIPGKNLRQV